MLTTHPFCVVALSRYGRMHFFSRHLSQSRVALNKAINVLDSSGYAQLQHQFDTLCATENPHSSPNELTTIRNVCLIVAEVRHNCAAASLAEWRGRQISNRLIEEEDQVQLNQALKMFGSAHSTRIKIAGPEDSSSLQSLLGHASVLGSNSSTCCDFCTVLCSCTNALFCLYCPLHRSRFARYR